MAPWLGTCTDLAEGQSSIPSTHIGSSQLPLTLVPGDLLPISGLHKHCICMLACTHLQTHNLKIKFLKEKEEEEKGNPGMVVSHLYSC